MTTTKKYMWNICFFVSYKQKTKMHFLPKIITTEWKKIWAIFTFLSAAQGVPA